MTDTAPLMVLAVFLASAVRYSMPLLVGTLGETVTERSGHLNLGVEGMMLMGGAAGFVTAIRTDSLVLSLLAAMGGAIAGALFYAVLTVTFRANQVVTGLALTLFGAGVANTVGKGAVHASTPPHIQAFFAWQPLRPDLSAIESVPVLGPAAVFLRTVFLEYNIYIYMAVLLAVVLSLLLHRTRLGLHLRVVGENPASADASGIRVAATRYVAILVGGALCGLAGLYLPLVHNGTWVENITGGRGWIVVALVIFVRWSPLRAMLGALLFGALEIIGFKLQGFPQLAGNPLFSQYIIGMYPYIITVIVLVANSARKKGGWRGPGALGLPYFREER